MKQDDEVVRAEQHDAQAARHPKALIFVTVQRSRSAQWSFNGAPGSSARSRRRSDYGLAMLPVLDEAKKPMRPWLTIEGAYVAAGSKQKDAAYELARFLTGTEAGLVLALEGRQLHTARAVYDDKRVSSDPVLKAFFDQLANAEAMPNRAEMTMVWSPATTAMNKIVKGSASPEAAIKEAHGAIQEAINALRKSR
ncbi:MAG: hypothetical protein U5L03_12165 [Burkholderiaceae bacterium]|nr:hypothetical protein [Burkholderiaceae bacterium]